MSIANAYSRSQLKHALGVPQDEDIPTELVDKIIMANIGTSVSNGDHRVDVTPQVKQLAMKYR